MEKAEKDVKTVKVTESASGEGYLIAGHVYKSTEILNIPVLENDDAEYIFDNIFHFAILDLLRAFILNLSHSW